MGLYIYKSVELKFFVSNCSIRVHLVKFDVSSRTLKKKTGEKEGKKLLSK